MLAWNIFLVVGLSLSFVNPEICRFGDVDTGCALPCGCSEGCNKTTGECLDGGTCPDGPPTGFPWHGPGCRIGNVAYDKKATQRGTAGRLVAGLAVDGDTATGDQRCAHTHGQIPETARWYVELKEIYKINKVTLFNRKYNPPYLHEAARMGNFRIGISNDTDFTDGSGDICLNYAGFVPNGGSDTLNCSVNNIGRYFFLHKNQGSLDPPFISICEVVVDGYRVIDCSDCPSTSSCKDLTGCSRCLPGYKYPDCKTKCKSGSWGDNCELKCSANCKQSSQCHITDGTCTKGCKDGHINEVWYFGPRCNISTDAGSVITNLNVSEVSVDTVHLAWSSTIPPNNVKYFMYQSWYKTNETEILTSIKNTTIKNDLGLHQTRIFSGLTAATNYTFHVRILRLSDNGSLYPLDSSMDFIQVTTNERKDDVSKPGSINTTGNIIGGVVGGVVILIVIVLVVGLVVYFLRSKKKIKEENTRHGHHQLTQVNQGFRNPSADVEDKPATNNKTWETEVYTNVDHFKDSTTIKMKDLQSYVGLKRSMPEGFKLEFQGIKNVLEKSSDNGAKAINQNKNRFRNISPYDDSRVVLEAEDSNDDYINASYIHGYKGKPQTYIASQGPYKETSGDMWQMIWQEHSNLIVMVTNFVEGGKKKCEMYWPEFTEDCKTYGKYRVTLSGEDIYNSYAYRRLLVERGKESRVVHHLQFLNWPDKTCPDFSFPLLAFRRKVRSFDDIKEGPLIVHCSAGVGRTGTFIALDILLRQMESENEVDVIKVVSKLRQDRMEMVQSVAQYRFLYEALLESSQCPNCAIPCSEFIRKYNLLVQEESLYTNETSLDQQFKSLCNLKPSFAKGNRQGLQKENIMKNRNNDIIPDDKCRVFLNTPYREGNDYINGLPIDSYKAAKAFIVTQMPLPNTVVDFWRLVVDHKCSAVVMLNELDRSDKSCSIYWPEEEEPKQKYGPLEVKLTACNTERDFISRDFEVRKVKAREDEIHTIRQFQLLGWERNEGLPKKKQILALLEVMERWQKQQSNAGPVIVHCMDGASRSGIYCSASYLLDKMRVDQEVDVFLAVRATSINRPQFVNTLAQFQFLYELALDCVDSNQTYANLG